MSKQVGDEFPALCEKCLGDDQHLKMMKHANGDECKICTRPFTVFRWKIKDGQSKFRKTVICVTCARARNSCQSCMLDINYMIPLDLRDTALKMAGLEGFTSSKYISNSTNREVKAIMADKQESEHRNIETDSRAEKAKAMLEKLARKFEDNSSALVKKSSRNDHIDKEALKQLKSAEVKKLVRELPFNGKIDIPDSETTATSFFIFGFPKDMPQYCLSDYCKKFGKLKLLNIVQRARCGFISFTTSKAAQEFARSIIDNGLNKNVSRPGLLILEQKYPLRVSWSDQKSLGHTNEEHHKLSLICTRVMKQLADQEKKTEAITQKSSKPKSSSSQTVPRSNQEKTTTTTYNSSKLDFEL
ncbi:Piso0_002637 [Millerozyma farinosa CBS 7064]|uniref:Pre-mRNA-splicing factor SLT11 n=1 Tax=Pichia sorbitophila (strain ATCC MYA-4447 / BCRC 22081 / CBS 7064 / NBRC 10061 / NRRL Y-12695) TaxID=559304 RepID=G8YFK3_PICSO|nr:Piso0_002637 [Millerozyma farinosa CBS 7064]